MISGRNPCRSASAHARRAARPALTTFSRMSFLRGDPDAKTTRLSRSFSKIGHGMALGSTGEGRLTLILADVLMQLRNSRLGDDVDMTLGLDSQARVEVDERPWESDEVWSRFRTGAGHPLLLTAPTTVTLQSPQSTTSSQSDCQGRRKESTQCSQIIRLPNMTEPPAKRFRVSLVRGSRS